MASMPRELKVVPQIPKLGTGKTDHNALRAFHRINPMGSLKRGSPVFLILRRAVGPLAHTAFSAAAADSIGGTLWMYRASQQCPVSTHAARGRGNPEGVEDRLAGDILGGGDLAQDGVESAGAQRFVAGNADAVMIGRLGLHDDVVADPGWHSQTPLRTEGLADITAVKIAGQSHASASSRTMCRCSHWGTARSK